MNGTRTAIFAAASILVATAHAADSIFAVPFCNGPATALASADLDGDGDLDVVAAGTAGLQTFKSDGAGKFVAAQLQSTIPNLSSVVLAKLNGDAAPDALARTLPAVLAYQGDGNGGFGSPITLLVGSSYGYPQTGDFNEDGRTDIVVGHGTPGFGLTVFFGTAAGPVNAPIVTPGGGGGGAFTFVVDVNGDGHQDVLDLSAAVNTWLGDGHGNLVNTYFTPAGYATSAQVADFDQDGKLDLLVQALFAGSVVNFWKGDGQGGFAAPVATSLPIANYRALDLDHDGKVDLIGLDSALGGGLRLHFATGPVQFAPPLDVPVSQNATAALPIDADGDGEPDLAVANGYGILLLHGNPSGLFTTNELYYQQGVAHVATGDVNDDGYDDLVTARGASQLGVSLGSSSAGFGPFSTGPGVGFAGAKLVDLSDLDTDGDLDAVISTKGSELHVFHGDGAGNFAVVQSTAAGSGFGSALNLRLLDVTADGIPDASLGFSLSGGIAGNLSQIEFLPGLQNGTLGADQTVVQILQFGVDLLVADLNGDDAGDYVMTFSTSTPRFVESNGAGGFLPPVQLGMVSFNATRIASGDLNGDGLSDLVFSEASATGVVQSLLGSGTGFTQGALAPTLESPQGIASVECADVDGDSKLDVAVLGETSGPTSVLELLRGDGAGGLVPAAVYAVASKLAGSRLRAFDAEHDGRIDFALASPASNRVEVLRNVLPNFFAYAGAGCAGSGGFVPRLRFDGVATPGGAVTLSLENAKGGASALLFTGFQPANVPLPGGCPLLTFPLLPIVFTLPLSGTQAGEGGFHLGGPLPGALGPGSVHYMQAIVIDSGAPFGFSSTNRAQLSVD